MALRRFTLATDNHPAYGYATIDDLSGSGEILIEVGWLPQAATVALTQQFGLPHEYFPPTGTELQKCTRDGVGGVVYSIEDYDGSSWSASTVASSKKVSLFNENALSSYQVSDHGWYINTASTPGPSDKVTLTAGDLTTVDDLWLMTRDDAATTGILYESGTGSDVSATYSLPTRTRYEITTGIASTEDIAEMVFVNGAQLQGDVYSGSYDYGIGSYDRLLLDTGELHISFESALEATDHVYFFVFSIFPRPYVRVKASSPFTSTGFIIEYGNIPKGDMSFNYYVR